MLVNKRCCEYSPSPASGLVSAPVRRVVISTVAPSNVVEVVHGAGASALPHVPSPLARVVITATTLLGNAADGAHGFVPVVDCGQSRRLGSTPAASRIQAIMQGSDLTHIIH